jgi:hypothetical protein
VRDIIGLYLSPPTHALVLCVDEKSQIQALDREQPVLPMMPGMLLRTGKTPSGKEAAGHIRRLLRHLRRHWPDTHITIRGDGHYPRRVRLGLPRCRSAARHRYRAQACADIAHAAVPPKPRAQSCNPEKPIVPNAVKQTQAMPLASATPAAAA